jgi:tyrosinase
LNDTLNAPTWDDGSHDKLGQMVYRVLNYDYTYYGEFASTKYNNDDPSTYTFLSLEFVHNDLHVSLPIHFGDDVYANKSKGFIGSGAGQNSDGHMAHISVAALDPIFWLHHW